MTQEPAGFALYVHWPFCARICPYCDFNVHRDRGVDAARWSAKLDLELRYWRAKTGARRLAQLIRAIVCEPALGFFGSQSIIVHFKIMQYLFRF